MGTRGEDINLTHLRNILCSLSGISSGKNNWINRNQKMPACSSPACDSIPSTAGELLHCCQRQQKHLGGLFILQWFTRSVQVLTKKKKSGRLKLRRPSHIPNPFDFSGPGDPSWITEGAKVSPKHSVQNKELKPPPTLPSHCPAPAAYPPNFLVWYPLCLLACLFLEGLGELGGKYLVSILVQWVACAVLGI